MAVENSRKPDKIARLVEYLITLAKINTRIVRTLEDYRKVLWVSSIPKEPKYCFTQAWGKQEERDRDIWIEIRKFQEPELPRIPEECSEWVKHETLRNTKDLPALKEALVVERTHKDPQTGEETKFNETVYLKEFPNVQKAWDTYLEKQWLPWTELYERYISVQHVYANLFHIYQEQQKLGEQYELVFCSGLLTWKTPTGHDSKRHIVVSKASLEFEPHLGKFTVKQAVDGDQVDIELDMLDVLDQPQNARQLIEDGRAQIGADLWDKNAVNSLLTSVANSLADSGQGVYRPDQMEPKHRPTKEKPFIEYAPALILRKRSTRSLENLLTSMKEQINAGGVVPVEFLDICESLPEGSERKTPEESAGRHQEPAEEIFFPLLANDEQRRIIRTLERQTGVLVQGPPGTGKSHTIANLICHLLAIGKRVLVTAKTPRALQVLHDKLPSSIKPLCINLLGQGTEERMSLEKSVTGILARLDGRGATKNGNKKQVLEKRLHSSRSEKAETDNKILALRESETYVHNMGNGQYSGTAAQIARKLEGDASKYSWFTDEVNHDVQLPLLPDEISSLCQDIVKIDFATEGALSKFLPDTKKEIPSAAGVRKAFRREAETRRLAEKGKDRLRGQEGQALLQSSKEDIQELLNHLSDFIAASETVRKRPMSWIEKAVYDVLTDKDTPWKELLKLSVHNTDGLHGVAEEVDAIDFVVPEDMDRRKLLHDAEALKVHFESGGGEGRWIFKPKIVRKHGDLIGKVRVDGFDCNTPESLQKLIDFIKVEQCLQYTWSLWAGKFEPVEGPFPIQLAEIDELHEALHSVIGLYDKREHVKQKLQKIRGLGAPRWENPTSLRTLVEDCRVVLAHIEYRSIYRQLDLIRDRLLAHTHRNDAHPINASILVAFEDRDAEQYGKLVEEVTELRNKALCVNRKRQIIGKIAQTAPVLAGQLAGCENPHLWAERVNQLEEAWVWAQTVSWLKDFLSVDLESLERHTRRLDKEIRKDLADLAAVKAWEFCFERMLEDHRRHLMSWQQSMKKLGKGTGKYAHTHRKNAQRHLNECRDAVPAWIMPLHRVYETVDPSTGVFDVIIIDEASQCGPEGLPLMYLGKRILIVGDDKQISPEAVGINRAQVQQLMQEFLYDFNHADSFDVDSSLFDHGRIRFNRRISLQEHFRCMPEIIRFSNDLCYQTDPLIPLRQYPPDRLQPLKAVAVQDGYREGAGNRVINRPEANAIVEAIEDCCADDRYQGMSIGVIALQGDSQAYHIEEQLLQRIGAEEMEKRRLVCGNPYSFQGDERDVIFLSMVAAPNERIGVMNRSADQRRFNVAASRAKDQMWLFYSATANHLSEQCFRRRLLEHFLNPASHISRALGEGAEELRDKAFRANRTIEKPPSPFDSWFELDVALHVAGKGYRIIPQYEFADKRIDLVVEGEKSQLAIECDGDFWHGADEYTKDMERQRKLERCGWQFFRIRESRYYANPEKALGPLWKLLNRMGISSIAEDLGFEGEESDNDAEDEEVEELGGSMSMPDGDDDESTERGLSGREEAKKYEPIDLDRPQDIHEALKVKPKVICHAIIQILEERPKFSCIREKVPTYILKLWNIRSRGKPRKQFAKRVDEQIAIMARKGYVIVYKSKNIRIKLGWVQYNGQ